MTFAPLRVGRGAGFTIKIPIRIGKQNIMTELYDQDKDTGGEGVYPMALALSADCNACEQTFATAVTVYEWSRYSSGEFVQDVWPDRSIDEREVIIANRPGNPFGKLGFFCDGCTEEAVAESEAAFDKAWDNGEPVVYMGWPQFDDDPEAA